MNQFKYLIRSKEYGNNTYKIAGRVASYSSSIGNAIHDELPSWISENGDVDHEVIRSDSEKFNSILRAERTRLQKMISDANRDIRGWNSELFKIEEGLGNDDPTGAGRKVEAAMDALGVNSTPLANVPFID